MGNQSSQRQHQRSLFLFFPLPEMSISIVLTQINGLNDRASDRCLSTNSCHSEKDEFSAKIHDGNT
jgi:hypothetical protein